MLSLLGVKPGDRVGLCMSNVPEFIVAFMAVTQLGAIAVTINAFWEANELAFGLDDSGCTVLLADHRRLMRFVEPVNILDARIAKGLKVVGVRCDSRGRAWLG